MADGLGLETLGLPRRGLRLSVRGMMGLVILCAGGAWAIRVVMDANRPCLRCKCVKNLKQIGLALYNYQEAYGSLPPAYLADSDGKPLHSWRVLILPFLEQPPVEDTPGAWRPRGWRDYRYDEPWDGPNNRSLVAPTPSFYLCPAHTDAEGRGLTSYVVVVGPRTAFPGGRPSTITVPRDGTSDTILVVESSNSSILWTEPRDLDWDWMSFQLDDPSRPSISSLHPAGSVVLQGDAGTETLQRSISSATVRARLTIDGGERIRGQEPTAWPVPERSDAPERRVEMEAQR